MNGTDLTAARKALGWTREQLAERTELSTYRIAKIEQGKHNPTGPELEVLEATLKEQLAETLVSTGEHPAIPTNVVDDTQSGTWNGLRRGDEVKVAGEKGRFRFLFHHQDDTQEYVQVFGPIPGSVSRGRNPKAAHQRSVRPERVVLP